MSTAKKEYKLNRQLLELQLTDSATPETLAARKKSDLHDIKAYVGNLKAVTGDQLGRIVAKCLLHFVHNKNCVEVFKHLAQSLGDVGNASTRDRASRLAYHICGISTRFDRDGVATCKYNANRGAKISKVDREVWLSNLFDDGGCAALDKIFKAIDKANKPSAKSKQKTGTNPETGAAVCHNDFQVAGVALGDTMTEALSIEGIDDNDEFLKECQDKMAAIQAEIVEYMAMRKQGIAGLAAKAMLKEPKEEVELAVAVGQ